MVQSIMAFDPGVTTGVVTEQSVGGYPDALMTTMEVRGIGTVWKTLHTGKPDVIVYEEFFYQRRIKVDLTPVEIIGVLKLYAELNGTLIVKQTPAMAKRFWTDDKVKKVGLWEPGAPHAMDAMRHFLYYKSFALKDQGYLERLKQ